MNVELNSNGVNKKIEAHILSDDEMREIGFSKNYYEGTDHEEHSPYWWFSKTIKFPNEQIYKNFEIPLPFSTVSHGHKSTCVHL